MANKKATEENIINVDEVYTKTEQFVDKNRKPLTYGLSAVALVVLVFAGYEYLIQAPANAKAENAMFQAEHYFSKDSVELAQYGDGFSAGLEEIMNDHSGTYAASRAAYLIGIANRDAGLFEEAIEAFEKVSLNDDVIKPFALTMRLAANMTGGHIAILALLSLIAIFAEIFQSAVAGIGVTAISVPMATAISGLEIIVVLVQAYVFTLLTAVFIGMAINVHH